MRMSGWKSSKLLFTKREFRTITSSLTYIEHSKELMKTLKQVRDSTKSSHLWLKNLSLSIIPRISSGNTTLKLLKSTPSSNSFPAESLPSVETKLKLSPTLTRVFWKLPEKPRKSLKDWRWPSTLLNCLTRLLKRWWTRRKQSWKWWLSWMWKMMLSSKLRPDWPSSFRQRTK